MEPRDLIWNVKVSKTEREQITELAKRLGTKKASVAFRFALHLALEQTDPNKNPDTLKTIIVIV